MADRLVLFSCALVCDTDTTREIEVFMSLWSFPSEPNDWDTTQKRMAQMEEDARRKAEFLQYRVEAAHVDDVTLQVRHWVANNPA